MRMYSYKQLPSIKKHENEPGAIINLVIITVIKIIAITIILITIIITIIIIIIIIIIILRQNQDILLVR